MRLRTELLRRGGLRLVLWRRKVLPAGPAVRRSEGPWLWLVLRAELLCRAQLLCGRRLLRAQLLCG
ncbi:hypothetical protein [Botrimarina sp.]|uniref:hypothetical protein n=1 Tax=Botrimarina sp. TaxID=2795802 RepID=UPI0032EB9505